MEADIRWLDDPQVFRVGQLPAHSDHKIYGSVEEMERQQSSLYQSLNGMSFSPIIMVRMKAASTG